MTNHNKTPLTRHDFLGFLFLLSAPVALISALNAPTALTQIAAIVALVLITAGAIVNAEN